MQSFPACTVNMYIHRTTHQTHAQSEREAIRCEKDPDPQGAEDVEIGKLTKAMESVKKIVKRKKGS